jgi:uncharacterized protein YybS (DUF2232 family)
MRDSSAMDAKSGQTFDVRYAVALGAGLASALLCVVARQGTLPALFIACFSPLPILIATLGFGPLPGLGAAMVGIAAISAFAAARPAELWTARLIYAALSGGTFALMLALPVWWLGRLTRLWRDDADMWRDSSRQPRQHAAESRFYPLSRILAHAAIFACVVAALVITTIVLDAGGFDSLAARVAPRILELFGPRELPPGTDLHELSLFYVRLFPPVMTAIYLSLALANLWLAGRIAQVSNILVRPWPDTAHALRLPRPFALAFLGSVALCPLDGFTGAIATCGAAALGLAFALEGLAVIHFVTRGNKFRTPLLAAAYVVTVIVPPMLIAFAAIGLADAGFSFRDRKVVAATQKS